MNGITVAPITSRLRISGRSGRGGEIAGSRELQGLTNSRMKDFFNLWHIGQFMAFEGSELAATVRGAFQR